MPLFLQGLFWFGLLTVCYTYFGYGILLYLIVSVKRLWKRPENLTFLYEPNITLMVAAYNEEAYIRDKIENSLGLNYPRGNIQFLFVTDGSNDRTPEIVRQFPEIKLMHQPDRQGKIMAVERAMPEVTGEIVVFTDANTLLNREALRNIVRHFADKKVGVVSGEKRILNREADEAAGAGEGFYWKYESKLKQWDDELYSVMGAAGELFAIRTALFEPIPKDSLIEDFYMSFKIVEKGYKIAYEPEAYAMEEPSASVKEELKRKIRIAAGGIQSIVRLSELLNPFSYGVITFQYVSHRVLRWTLAPLALPLVFLANLLLWNQGVFYQYVFVGQVMFYLAALLGLMLEKKQVRLKVLFIPYYFCMMNYAVYAGFKRYLKGSQSVLWEKAARRTH
ncbi:MAG: glycosyltransferase family 2 protein [Cyclobacteriaceae bacterium]|nr:glycosyltransferase family 2 protein [Cyclobacteriaceae bacterium]